jgi:Cu-Zn family superoxide dismutase
VAAGAAACARPAHRAIATFQPVAGSRVAGTATFTERDDGLTMVVVRARNLTPGGHGVHVHEHGDCSAPDASSAGDHFNPDGGEHGHPAHHHHHGGDLGNLIAGEDGSGVLEVKTDALSVQPGPRSVVGRSIIIHEAVDDLMTQPGGASGDRIGCGLIQLPSSSAAPRDDSQSLPFR